MSNKSLPHATFTDRVISPLKLRRLGLGLRQLDLGRMAGIPPNLITLYERGVSRPRPEKAAAIADVLDVSVEEIFPDLERPVGEGKASRGRHK